MEATVDRLTFSRTQLQDLLASCRDCIINVADILEDQRRQDSYQPFPQAPHSGPYSDDSGGRRDETLPSEDVDGAAGLHRAPDNESRSHLLGPRMFQAENSKARKNYSSKHLRSLNMFKPVANLAPEYHFQYKFYSDDSYTMAPAFDPWEWTQWTGGTDENLNIDDLFSSVLDRKSELMEALFPLQTNQLLQSMSWPELESSFALHLKEIINRTRLCPCDNAIGYVDGDVTLIILEIGRFLNEIENLSSLEQRKAGDDLKALGPVTGRWSAQIRKSHTLQELHKRCESKGLLSDWDNKPIQKFQLGHANTRTTVREGEIGYILQIILSIGTSGYEAESSRTSVSEEASQEFLLDLLDKLSPDTASGGLEQADGQTFKPEELGVGSLKALGGLKIAWTDNLDDHLRMLPASRTLKVFWDVSLLDQSLLFWHHARCLRPSAWEPSKVSALYELKTTYRLLFHNTSARHFTTAETCDIRNRKQDLGILIHDLRVDINSRRARRILRHFNEAPVPTKIRRNKGLENQRKEPRQSKSRWRSLNRVLNNIKPLIRGNPRKRGPEKLSTYLAAGPPYPLDLCWHLENLLLPYPQFVGESESLRSFDNFPRFGPRLRELKFHMDNQKPTGWWQMWKDKRDRVQHVTFWAVLVFGTISVVLALVTVAVSSAQTAAAFRAIHDGDKE